MYALCCTAKVLQRIGFPLQAETLPETTVLGNWYAHLLFIHRFQLVLCVSDQSRLAVITPAKGLKTLSKQLPDHLIPLLASLGLPEAWIEQEIRAMNDVYYTWTRSKSILGTMNDYANQLEYRVEREGGPSLLQLALDLSICPCGPLNYDSSEQRTKELFQKRFGN